ncbi:MAG TPA: DinB family protein [Pseudonocardiaceae bacterium]|nr:DinB family protein [Pseudonocardiaceae bacterium]
MTEAVLDEPPVAGSELDTLLATLERNRRTLAWKCEGLDAHQMSRSVGTSAITIGGLLRHLTRCEASTFRWKLHGRAAALSEADWASDWQWTGDEDVEAVWRDWRAAVARSRELVAEAYAQGGLEFQGHEFPGWGAPSLRRLVTDMIEEYARHLGHADLIREAIDGRVGEDAPR